MKPLTLLTPREKEILRLKAHGATNKEVGGLLGIDPQTVKNHLTSVYRVLRVRGLTEALRVVGWLRPPE